MERFNRWKIHYETGTEYREQSLTDSWVMQLISCHFDYLERNLRSLDLDTLNNIFSDGLPITFRKFGHRNERESTGSMLNELYNVKKNTKQLGLAYHSLEQNSRGLNEQKRVTVQKTNCKGDYKNVEFEYCMKRETNLRERRTEIHKKSRNTRLNARTPRLMCPKSPLMAFHELYGDEPKIVDKKSYEHYSTYVAQIEINGVLVTVEHVSKAQAKQKACEYYFREMLARKLYDESIKKNNNNYCRARGDGKNGPTAGFDGPAVDNFPWKQFVSMAMHYLIIKWQINEPRVVYPGQADEDSSAISLNVTPVSTKKLPGHPENYNPIALLYIMIPYDIEFTTTQISSCPSLFQMRCEIDGFVFIGQGSSKKKAKTECAINVIRHFWNFDYGAVHRNMANQLP